MSLAALLDAFLLDPPSARARRVLRVGLARGLWRVPATPAAWTTLARLRRDPVALLPRLNARVCPEGLAWADARRALSWRQAEAAVARLAGGLAAAHGVGPGSRVLVALPNRVEYPVLWFALARLGATAVHASATATRAELDEHIASSDTTLAVVGPDGARPSAGRCLGVEALWALEGPDPGPPPGGAESVVFTSGTTGRAKGARRDFGKLGAAEALRILERLPLIHGERHLLVAPLHHSAAQAFLMLVAALGGGVWLEAGFDAARLWRRLATHRSRSVFLVPTMIRRLLALPTPRPPSLEVVVSGAAPFPVALREAAIARFGARRVFDFYGATELGWVTLCDGVEMRAAPGTVGRPLGGVRLSIRDAEGRASPPGAVGRVHVRTAQAFDGYLGRGAGDPGWIGVGDLGRLDASGRLFIEGRVGDMVISGGLNLYPAEIEAALMALPAVQEAAVIGLPDAEWGERLVAFVVDGDAVATDAQLEAALRERLAGYKIPRRWIRVAALPRNATGKLVRARLREMGRALSGG